MSWLDKYLHVMCVYVYMYICMYVCVYTGSRIENVDRQRSLPVHPSAEQIGTCEPFRRHHCRRLGIDGFGGNAPLQGAGSGRLEPLVFVARAGLLSFYVPITALLSTVS